MMATSITTATQIRHAKDQEIRVSELARKTGVSKATISRILSGDRLPSWPMAKKIAGELGITLNELDERLPAA